MADVSKTVAIIFEGHDKTGAALAGIESKLGGVGAEAGTATGKVGQLDTELEQVGRREAAVESLATAFKALAAAVVVKEFIDANVQLEKFERAMVLIKGSTEGAAVEFEYIKTLANRLGLEIGATADAYVSLSAATKGSSLQGQATRDIFEAVSIAMSSLGKSSADTQGALLAISQMVSKGTVSLEELRGQLGERLPGAFQLAASAMGLSTQELDKFVSSGNLTAEVFLPKFAAEMKKTFGDVRDMEGYTASLNRMQNAATDAFQQIGQTGVFDLLTKGVQIATASVTGIIAAFKAWAEILGTIAGAIASGNFSGVGDAVDAAMQKAANSTRDASNAMLGVKDATDKTAVSVDNVSDALSRKLAKGTAAAVDLEKATKDVDKALKELGLDPGKFEKPIANIVKAFDDLAKNPAVKGDQLLSGLLVTLDKIAGGPNGAGDIKNVSDAIESAFKRGALSASEYAAATNALEVKQKGLWDGMIRTTGTIQDQKKAHDEAAKATEKQKDQAFQLRIELEKLTSNERIKLIEAKVKLDVAEFEFKAKIVEAAFRSIDASIESTGKLVGDLWKLMDNPSLTFSDKWALEDQIEKENERRDQAFKLQKALTEATIKEIEARTKAFQSGDALIKIDGAGLQPHLEAFMWEILRTLQVRVNADGLKLLLNT
jgi:tape measure domain-containing protein